jgi:hypothetical protein
MSEHRDHVHPIDAGDALRALPLPAPPRSGWPALAARLQRRRRRRWLTGLALAASLLLAALLPFGLDRPRPVPAAQVEAAQALQTLRHRSAELEAVLAANSPTWVDSGDSALLDQHFAMQLQWVDLQLTGLQPDAGTADQLPLWIERVALLARRAELAEARLLTDHDPQRAAGDILFTL